MRREKDLEEGDGCFEEGNRDVKKLLNDEITISKTKRFLGGIKFSRTKGVLRRELGPEDVSREQNLDLETHSASKRGRGTSKIKRDSKSYAP